MPARLEALDPRNWGDIARAYRYLIAAGWRIFVRRERVDEWPSVARAGAAAKAAPPVGGAVAAPAASAAAESAAGEAAAEATRIARSARWTNTAARYPVPWARCLQRSLALCLWLEDLNMAPALRFGVRKSVKGKGGIDAHAWVEYEGRVVNDSDQVSGVFATLENKESANS
jgi:hypothetical protein